jgi:hypothetical protein
LISTEKNNARMATRLMTTTNTAGRLFKSEFLFLLTDFPRDTRADAPSCSS